MITVRPARPEDATQLVDLINTIIQAGGTTAHQTLFDNDRMMKHYLAPDLLISCQVAIEEKTVVGLQSLEWSDPEYEGPDPRPSDWAVIASFVKQGQQGKGIGQLLFNATKTAAMLAGVKAIDATIRVDNTVGLAFYEKLGFNEDGCLANIPLTDGTPVDRVRKAFHF